MFVFIVLLACFAAFTIYAFVTKYQSTDPTKSVWARVGTAGALAAAALLGAAAQYFQQLGASP